MLRYCLQPLKKWGSGTAQESPGCCILHLPSLPSGFLLGQTLSSSFHHGGIFALVAAHWHHWIIWGEKSGLQLKFNWFIRETQGFQSCAALVVALNKWLRQFPSPLHSLPSRGSGKEQCRAGTAKANPPLLVTLDNGHLCQRVGKSWLLQVAAKVPSVPVCPVALSTPCGALLCLLNQVAGPRHSGQTTLRVTSLLEDRVYQNKRLLGTMHLLN